MEGESFGMKFYSSFYECSSSENQDIVLPDVALFLLNKENPNGVGTRIFFKDLDYPDLCYPSDFPNFTVDKSRPAIEVIGTIIKYLKEDLINGQMLMFDEKAKSVNSISMKNPVITFNKKSKGVLEFNVRESSVLSDYHPIIVQPNHISPIFNSIIQEASKEISPTSVVHTPLHELKEQHVPKEQQEKTSECVICLERPSEMVITVCGHFGLCSECGKTIDKCPACRAPFTPKQIIKLFKL